MRQVPALQVGVPLLELHASPQPPHAAMLLTSVSQPGSLVQSAYPVSHAPIWHVLELQNPSACGKSFVQSFPHPPQLSGSLAVADSQPSRVVFSGGEMLQSLQPLPQAIVH